MKRTTLNRAYGDFFGKEQWEHYSTLTYKFAVSINRNRIEMDKLTKYFKKQVATFSIIWVCEWHTTGTSTHSHLLTKGVDVALIDKYWSNRNLGYKKFNDHKVYERDKGANFYMAKYIDKEIDYDIFISKDNQLQGLVLN
ncbi:MAG: hypothetical protein ABR81_02035 [Cryomorphaceae bacterium BACL11 MAG-121128-bin16]|jgi:hypothetical protein|nr:MAG: hypothetical protein ABR81_02035 [Cryomorphaceae bacterium BACL11 MAG-121128-bin16]